MAGESLDTRRALGWIGVALGIYLMALLLPPPAKLGHEGQAVLGTVVASVVLWTSGFKSYPRNQNSPAAPKAQWAFAF